MLMMLIVYAGRMIHKIRKNTETLAVASKENGVEVNAEKRKYMLTSQDQNAGPNHDRDR
jgi:hypothetical protein